MTEDVLVPMGRKDASDRALEFAFEEYPDASVTVMHVVEPSTPFGIFGGREPSEYMITDCRADLGDQLIPDPDSFKRAQRKRAEAVLERACEVADEYGREIDPVVEDGRAEQVIVDHADTNGVDHIVMADHERTALRPPLVGGVSEAVAKRTSIPVTIVS